MGSRTLEKEARLGDKTIKASKANLSRKFQCLNGKSLIEITPHNKKLETADTVTIMDIWPENYAYFKNKVTCRSSGDTGVVVQGTRVSYLEGHKKEPCKKEPRKKIDSDGKPEDGLAPGEEKPKIKVRNPSGKEVAIDESEIYRLSLTWGFRTEIVTEAIKRLRQQKAPVRDVMRYIEATCRNIARDEDRIARKNAPPKKNTPSKTQPNEDNAPPKETPKKHEGPRKTFIDIMIEGGAKFPPETLRKNDEYKRSDEWKKKTSQTEPDTKTPT